jgi:hypothetical protein
LPSRDDENSGEEEMWESETGKNGIARRDSGTEKLHVKKRGSFFFCKTALYSSREGRDGRTKGKWRNAFWQEKRNPQKPRRIGIDDPFSRVPLP